MSVSTAVLDRLLLSSGYSHTYRKLSSITYPNQILDTYEVSFSNASGQLIAFRAVISLNKSGALLEYALYDYLGNSVPNLSDRIVEPFFYELDPRQYSADYSKIAICWGKSPWF
jgi:hypothetical protein